MEETLAETTVSNITNLKRVKPPETFDLTYNMGQPYTPQITRA